ncbi:hypothetical protein [Candidatus Odyssella acanthamoebae]|uniref:Endonuclease/exonuclease/phosphatase domain-containing protein n=1 Tax=Candidatus Odyssella acanthamoebae TaxID=91604 RepID=A0A077AY09_9PROT|nr:hypothetical protein [Candidatus Paracaedibacter acanthamoebae]AIK95630.1 hypothetical protein ID47_01005 [Candidatus Paracaedibacter acanthamoebae]
MTRIVFWNLLKFTMKRINDPKNVAASAAALNNILNVFKKNTPDIFALIELPCGKGGKQGELVGKGSAYQGALQLLKQLNALPGAPVWDLVPPIVTGAGGRREGIVVFFNKNTVQFQGPWKFDGTTTRDPTSPLPPGGWKDYSATHWKIPGGTTVKKWGGQWEFIKTGKKGEILEFPTAGERRPWLTRFQELKGGKRTIDVIAFHAPFTQASPVNAAISLIGTSSIAPPFNTPMAVDVCVLGGDFNVDANDNTKRAEAYGPLMVAPKKAMRTKKSTPGGNFTGNFLTPITPPGVKTVYAKTSLKAVKTASIKGGDYPDYDYASSSYDQIFIRYKTPGAAKGEMDINEIAGAYIKKAGPLAGGGLPAYGYAAALPSAKAAKKGYTYAPGMQDSIKTIFIKKVKGVLLDSTQKDALFRQVNNYGFVRRTSDHMGVIIDV